MNKYALTLSLMMLSVLLGYFGSELKIEHFCAFLAVAAVGVIAVGYFLSNKRQKGGDKNE